MDEAGGTREHSERNTSKHLENTASFIPGVWNECEAAKREAQRSNLHLRLEDLGLAF